MPDLPIWVVSAFGSRRPDLLQSLASRGVAADRVNFIESPYRDAWREAPDRGNPSPYWRDRVNPKLLSNGEMSCFVGHLRAWQAIVDSGSPGIILEDDARALRRLPRSWPEWCGATDVLYLGYKALADFPDHDSANEWRRAPFVWWTIGYALHPEAADLLLESADGSLWIPPDEFLPYHCGLGLTENRNKLVHVDGTPGLLTAWCANSPIVEPSGDASNTDNYDPAFRLEVVLFGTDAERLRPQLEAWRDFGFSVTALGVGKPGWDVNYEGGRPKFEWLLKWLDGMSADDLHNTIVLALDGYDTARLPHTSQNELLRVYGSLRWPCIVSGERIYWPERGLSGEFNPVDYGDDDGQGGASREYPFPCSGVFMGVAADLAHCIGWALEAYPGEADDQALMHRIVLANRGTWRIDDGAALAISLKLAEGDIDGDGYNHITHTRPLIYHANNDSKLPAVVTGIQAAPAQASPRPEVYPYLYGHPVPIMAIPHDMLLVPLMSPDEARRLAALLLTEPGWGNLEGDDVPGDELRTTVLDPLRAMVTDHVLPLLHKHLALTSRVEAVRDIFAIRHHPDGQNSLRLHTDISVVSGSIKLMDSTDGGELIFPRQGWSDRLMEPGCSVWWPSAITHPHATTRVHSGIRLAVTVWTQ